MGELLAGVLVTAAALVAILEPLFRRSLPMPVPEADSSYDEEFELEESDSPRIRALLALKEIEFDRATGKLSESDYSELKAKYSAVAMAAIKEEESVRPSDEEPVRPSDEEAVRPTEVEAAPVGAPEDRTEAAIHRARSKLKNTCPKCGPRPEKGAVFCSACGRTLSDPDSRQRCWLCGEGLSAEAKYCGRCGGQVAA